MPADPGEGSAAPSRDPQPVMVRLAGRRSSRPRPFHAPRSRTWLALGLVALLGLVAIPLRAPEYYPRAQQAATVLALVFLLSAAGLWFGMQRRAFLVASVIVAVLLAVSRTSALAFGVSDLFLAALVVSFVLFALAGFYVVLVLEEAVHDAHRLLQHADASPAWSVAPLLLLAALGIALPVWPQLGGPLLATTWAVDLVAMVLVAGWWLWRLHARKLMEQHDPTLRELHLLAAAGLLAGVLVDLLEPLSRSTNALPNLLAYLVLLGTWVYVSYTTLQRTHMLLPGKDARPWLALMLAASFAILVHSRQLFDTQGHQAIEGLLGRRVTYLAVGLWAGIAFHIVRTLAEALLEVRRRSRARVADAAARLATGLSRAESRVGDVAVFVFREVDRLLPGERHPPQRRAPARSGPPAQGPNLARDEARAPSPSGEHDRRSPSGTPAPGTRPPR